MKRLLAILERLRPTFEPGGHMGLLKPLFEAMENFFFAPSTTTLAAPHVRDPLDIKRVMSMVIVALFPCILAALYFFGLRVLAMIVVSYAVGGAVEVIFAIVMVSEKAAARELDEATRRRLQDRVLDDWLAEEQKRHNVEFHGFKGAYDSETDAWAKWQLHRMKRQD